MNFSPADFKVLVVDDDVKACATLKRVLEKKFYNVEVAYGGEEALEKVYVSHPHVVLLDVLMPGLTGDELVKTIKAWKPEIEIIMISAALNKEVIEDCLRNGAFACLEKPIDLDFLFRKIAEALAGKERE